MNQYCKIKTQYLDFIVFFQLGSFFETYFEDAITVSNIAGIALTKRSFKETGDIPLAGVPKELLDTTLQKLINAGYKITVVNQTGKTEDNRQKREVAKIYTTGTLIAQEFLNSKKNNYIVSLYKNNNTYEISYADVSVGQIFASAGDKTEVINEIARINPVEIIAPFNFDFCIVGYKTEKINENFFENEEGQKSASNGIINYSKYILKEDMIEFEDLKKYSIKNILSIDFRTRKNLELTANGYNNTEEGSLLSVFDKCKTPMGRRLLVNYITTPLINLSEIKKRQNSLKKYINSKDIKEKINNIIENMADIARLATKLSNETITPLELFSLKENLKTVIDISKIISVSDFDISQKCDFELLNDFYEILNRTINDDIDEVQKGNFLKQGADSKFDIYNDEYKKAVLKLQEYEKSLIKKTGILKLKITKKSGTYMIEIPTSSVSPLNSSFMPIQKLKNAVRYTTNELIELEDEISSIETKIYETKSFVFKNLKKYAKEMTSAIREYSKLIAVLDVLNSFYTLLKSNKKYIFAEFSENAFELKEMRHPIAEEISEFEPLDFNFDGKKFMILTGANGSGKSMFLKTTAINIILAHTGFICAAKSAVLPVFEKIFSILSISDEILNRKSVHQAQMSALAYICDNLNDKSLVLIDELGKNTSYTEGVSLTFGTIKYFLEKNIAKTVLTTHFEPLSSLGDDIKDKILYNKIEYKENKRRVEKGFIESSNGIKSAENEHIPQEIARYACEYLASNP